MTSWQQRCQELVPELFSSLDLHFAARCQQWWCRAGGAPDAAAELDLVFLAGALVSMELGAQNSCLDLAGLAANDPLGVAGERSYPAVAAFADVLLGRIAAAETDAAGGPMTPLVLAGDLLYLRACWLDEVTVAGRLLTLANSGALVASAVTGTNAGPAPVGPQLEPMLNQLFPAPADGSTNWQRVAAEVALQQQLTVITGGPGTGKTTTVAGVLALLLSQADTGMLPVIRLAAPTGKAAARLTESLRSARATLQEALSPLGAAATQVLASMPDDAQTLHRLLGFRAMDNLFRHGRDQPLVVDVVVLDEASMVDLRMMAQLCSALPANARLLLLGDRNQLSSVEAGRVLGDICAGVPAGQGYSPGAPLANCQCELLRSHRFRSDSGLGGLAAAMNAGDAEQVLARLAASDQDPGSDGQDDGSVVWQQRADLDVLAAAAVAGCRGWLELVAAGAAPDQVLKAMAGFQVLAAVRTGDHGVDGLNQRISAALAAAGLIQPSGQHYPGRPVLVQVNDYQLGLFNGDQGVLLPDADGDLRAWFQGADGQLLDVPTQRLPEHNTVFAMTVHKAQGSEFGRVALVLPPAPAGNESRLLTRELVYTGITRARAQVLVFATAPVLTQATVRRTRRTSGLAARLWPSPQKGTLHGAGA